MDTLKILYWNTFNKDLLKEINELVNQYDINFIVLLENNNDTKDVKAILNNQTRNFEFINHRGFDKAKIYCSIKDMSIKEIHGHGRYGIYTVNHSLYEPLLLSVVHFPSKLNWDSEDYTYLCGELKRDIEYKESQEGHSKTIVFGDFNMNPFENGLIASGGLHNTFSREIALKKSREFNSTSYSYFYNPMWSFFGDYSKGNVLGTFYINTYRPINYHWNIYDQIMLRPSLIQYFDDNNLDIISKIGSKTLLRNINGITKIDKTYSDHLPIKFELRLKKIEL